MVLPSVFFFLFSNNCLAAGNESNYAFKNEVTAWVVANEGSLNFVYENMVKRDDILRLWYINNEVLVYKGKAGDLDHAYDGSDAGDFKAILSSPYADMIYRRESMLSFLNSWENSCGGYYCFLGVVRFYDEKDLKLEFCGEAEASAINPCYIEVGKHWYLRYSFRKKLIEKDLEEKLRSGKLKIFGEPGWKDQWTN